MFDLRSRLLTSSAFSLTCSSALTNSLLGGCFVMPDRIRGGGRLLAPVLVA